MDRLGSARVQNKLGFRVDLCDGLWAPGGGQAGGVDLPQTAMVNCSPVNRSKVS